jgi:hypothetical protein
MKLFFFSFAKQSIKYSSSTLWDPIKKEKNNNQGIYKKQKELNLFLDVCKKRGSTLV